MLLQDQAHRALDPEEYEMAVIRDSVLIDSSPEKVHNYVSRVDKWANWFSGLGDLKQVDGDGAVGTVVHQSYSLAGKNVEVVTTVKENAAKPGGGYIWRGERGGGLPGGMSIDFDPQDGKTLVTGELDYQMPGGIFGKMAGHLGVKQTLERGLRHTLENLKNLSEEDWFVGRNEKEEEWPRPCDS
jgi:coenzyme Q-binding protein COQ10